MSGWTHSDWIQLAVAVFTLGYLLATIFILNEMRDAKRTAEEGSAEALRLTRESNDLTRESLKFTRESVQIAHRPYLVAEEFSGTDFGTAPDMDTMTGYAMVRNTGTTGANNVIFDAKFLDVPHGVPFEARSTINVIPNAGTRILSVGVQGWLPPIERLTHMYRERQEKLARGEIDICFVGAVTYQDFFDGWHRYWFSYRRNSQGEWYFYRDDRATGPPADWFDANMAWATTAKLPPMPPE